MKLLVSITLLAALAVAALGHPDPALDWHWQLWKKTYGKEYRHEVGTSSWGPGWLWALGHWVLLLRPRQPARSGAGRRFPGVVRQGLPTALGGLNRGGTAAGAVTACGFRPRKGPGAPPGRRTCGW